MSQHVHKAGGDRLALGVDFLPPLQSALGSHIDNTISINSHLSGFTRLARTVVDHPMVDDEVVDGGLLRTDSEHWAEEQKAGKAGSRLGNPLGVFDVMIPRHSPTRAAAPGSQGLFR